MSDKQKKPLIAAALGETPSRYPIWFMRQAGRYLPEYMEIRSKTSFTDLYKSPKMAAKVTLQPLERYDLDAAIIFSDILVPVTGMGQGLTFGAGHGPMLTPVVRSMDDVKKLKHPDCKSEFDFLGESISRTKESLNSEQTMIGFAGAPFTVASYMIEGGSSSTFVETKKLAFTDPEAFRMLLELLRSVTADYLRLQVDAGAEALMLFDSWAAQFSSADYRKIVFPVVSELFEDISDLGVPLIYYSGQGSDRFAELKGLKTNVISVDWRCSLTAADTLLKSAGLDVTLQGNLDPHILVSKEDVIRSRTRDVLTEAQGLSSHIFNVGHGLMPHTPLESLSWVIDEVRKF